MTARFLIAALCGLVISTPAVAAECAMSTQEKNWIEGSLAAWRYMAERRLKLPPVRPPTVIVFNDKCRFEAAASPRPEWVGEPHKGSVRLPDGSQTPAQVTSFTSHDKKSGVTFFVMALPPVWSAAKIPISSDLKGLTGVFLHEFSHARQVEPLRPVFEAATARFKEPEDLSDDRIQQVFQDDPAYLAVAEKERDLLFQAANEPDQAKAKALARDALALIEARRKRWFVGDDAVWAGYDDLFLTMEGFGQWVAYAWLSDPKGGGLTAEEAQRKMRGSRKWWSQDQGFSAFLIIDRFVPGWPALAFADKPALATDLLRMAVTDKR